MKVDVRLCSLMAAVLTVLTAAPVSAASPKNIFPEAARQVEGGRTLQVLVAQQEIKSDINKSNIAVAAGGGLMMALIDAAVEAERAKKAEAAIVPLRAELQDFDADTLAMDTTKKVADQAPWLQPTTLTLGRDSSLVGKSGVLDASVTPQVAFFEYSYDVSPDFSSIRVGLNMQVANRAVAEGKKPESRLHPKQLAYAQTVTTVISLPSPSKNMAENAARWSADDGKLARQALAAGFEELAVLAPRALSLTEADLKTMAARDKKNVVAGGFGGRLQEETPTGKLIYNGALVQVKTIAE